MKKIRLTTDLVEAISKCECPACAARLDGRTRIDEKEYAYGIEAYQGGTGHPVPKANDVSVCLYCKAKLVFVDHPDGYLRVRLMTPEETEALPEAAKRELSIDLDAMVERASQEETEPEFFRKWVRSMPS